MPATPPSALQWLSGAVALLDAGALLDLAADVLHRLHRAHARDHVEVVDRRRRGGEPLQGVALPRVGAREPAALAASYDVEDGDQDARGEDERADRRDQVVELEV